MCNPKTVNAMDIVQQHWEEPPQWVLTLAQYCDEHTQVAAAQKIRRSASLVNMVLKNRYTGSLSTVQALVETVFKAGEIACPILGGISGSECLKHQSAPYNPSNHMAVSMFRACRRCPNRKGGVHAGRD